jgi:hypothetical protein
MESGMRLTALALGLFAVLSFPWLFLPHSAPVEFLRGLGVGILFAVPLGLLIKKRARR